MRIAEIAALNFVKILLDAGVFFSSSIQFQIIPMCVLVLC